MKEIQMTEIETNLFKELIESVSKNRKSLRGFIKTLLENKQFELAAQLRELETELYPEAENDRTEIEFALLIKQTLLVAGLQMDPEYCWIVSKMSEVLKEKGGSMSLEDIFAVVNKQKELFSL